MRRTWVTAILVLAAVAASSGGTGRSRAAAGETQASAAAGKLILYGDITLFAGRGQPDNCTLRSRYKRGEPVGFRMTAIDPTTGERSETAELVVHLSYGGKTQDIPMRYRATAQQPQLTFWVAKWIVPAEAPVGIVRYTVTAKDKNGRTGEFKPFDNDQSQLTIVE